jgi:calcineurin-like phosphoesterase family protein
MPNIFLISDTHFGHDKMYEFIHTDGERVRREFNSVEEGDEEMVSRWNSVVKPSDKVYHLGDVFIKKAHSTILQRLNGKKVLIKGNHDIFNLKTYTSYFKDIRAYHRLDNFVLSHIPIHRDSLAKIKANIHGHLHRGIVTLDNKQDGLYISVCVEHINYTPLEFSVIQQIYK